LRSGRIDLSSTTVNRTSALFRSTELPQDPGTIFGGLLAGCIRDDYVKEDRKTAAEGVLFLLLGACCSVATTYVLSLAGFLL
jgi:hypothetical protein